MPPKNADDAYLADMLAYGRDLVAAIAGKDFEAYRADTNLRLAVERRIEIIGEAARHVSEECQAEHPEIPWRSVIGQRNVLVHGYAEIDDERIWRVATTHMAELIQQLERFVPPAPASGDDGK